MEKIPTYFEKIDMAELANKINPNLSEQETIDIVVVILNEEAIKLVIHGKLEEAVENIAPLVEGGLEYSILYNTLGMAYLSANNPFRASLNFEKAIRINPNIAGIHGNLAVAYMRMKKVDPAITEFKKALKLGYKREDMFLDAIKFCEENHRYEDSSYFSGVQEGLQNP
jgi:tetratricopeptide (TPR) repeat protein